MPQVQTVVDTIISGGQIGADIAGLRAGVRLGLNTGGWMPQGYRTLQGPRPEYALAYGVWEHECRGYPPRTRNNVQDSDGTVRFAHNFHSSGERCTQRAISEFRRPQFDVLMLAGDVEVHPDYRNGFRVWLADHSIRILNVAGNASVWMELPVEDFLVHTLSE